MDQSFQKASLVIEVKGRRSKRASMEVDLSKTPIEEEKYSPMLRTHAVPEVLASGYSLGLSRRAPFYLVELRKDKYEPDPHPDEDFEC